MSSSCRTLTILQERMVFQDWLIECGHSRTIYSIVLNLQYRVEYRAFQDYVMLWLQYRMSSRTGWVGWSFQDSYYTIEESRVSSRTHGTHTLDYNSFQDWVRLVLFMVVQSFYGFLYSMVQSTILGIEEQNSRSSTTVKCCTNFFKLAIHGHLNQFLTR